jgi:hypothetical protein
VVAGRAGHLSFLFREGCLGFRLHANLYRHQKLRRSFRRGRPQQLNRNQSYPFQAGYRQNWRHTQEARLLGFLISQTILRLNWKADMMASSKYAAEEFWI